VRCLGTQLSEPSLRNRYRDAGIETGRFTKKASCGSAALANIPAIGILGRRLG